MEDYKVDNELINSMWINPQLNNLLTYMLREKNIEIHHEMIMIWTSKN
jgi:hypothetical protein